MSHPLSSLASQVIVITGATSRIGLTTARMAARQGATLVLGASNATTLERLASEIRQAGGAVLAVPVDVGSMEQVAALGRTAMRTYGRVDTWVNAGMAMDDPDEVNPAPVAARLFKSHYWGANHGASVAHALMQHDGGAIINLDSDGSTRHGVKGFTDALRADIETDGAPISVTLVHAAGAGMHDAPRQIAEAILNAAQHAQRDVVVDGAPRVRTPAPSMFAPRLMDKFTAFFAPRHASKALHG